MARKSVRLAVLFPLTILTLVSCAGVPDPASPVQQFVQDSDYVFVGTIMDPGSTNVPGVQASPHTYVVRVDRVMRGPEFFSHLVSKDITVLVQDRSGLKPAQQWLFFANGQVIGRALAVAEVGRVKEYGSRDIAERIQLDTKERALRPIRARLGEADAVLAGEVRAVRARPSPPGMGVSEHDPQWSEATIQVSEVIKGDLRDKTVTVIFPASRDVAWYLVPKLAAGQRGVWLLSREPTLKMLAVTTRFDFQPIEQIDKLKEMVRQAQ